MASRPPRLPCLAALLLCGALFAACQAGPGRPEFGHRELAPTRSITGERVELEQYGGAWLPVAEADAQDRPTLDQLWSALQRAGIPATSVAHGNAQRLKVPGPHAATARRVLAAEPGAGSRFRVVRR